jgi:hypothetical protein
MSYYVCKCDLNFSNEDLVLGCEIHSYVCIVNTHLECCIWDLKWLAPRSKRLQNGPCRVAFLRRCFIIYIWSAFRVNTGNMATLHLAFSSNFKIYWQWSSFKLLCFISTLTIFLRVLCKPLFWKMYFFKDKVRGSWNEFMEPRRRSHEIVKHLFERNSSSLEIWRIGGGGGRD